MLKLLYNNVVECYYLDIFMEWSEGDRLATIRRKHFFGMTTTVNKLSWENVVLRRNNKKDIYRLSRKSLNPFYIHYDFHLL